MVCKTWNFFLINDRKLWMDILRQTHPYFEFLSRQLLSDEEYAADAKTKLWKRYFDFIEEDDSICSYKIIQLFKWIQMIQVVLQDVIQECPVYEVFRKEFIGETLAGKIQLQIVNVEKEKQPIAKSPKWGDHFRLNVAELLQRIALLKVSREELRFRKEKDLSQYGQEYKNLHQEWLELSKKKLKTSEELLFRKTLATLFCSR